MHTQLRAEAIAFSYPGLFLPLLKDVTFDLPLHGPKRARVGLIGPNGHGKSTLFKLITGELSPQHGRLIKPRAGLRVGYLPQAWPETMRDVTLRDAVCSGLSSVMALGAEVRALEGAMGEMEPAALDNALVRYGVLQERFSVLDGYRVELRVAQVLSGLGLADVSLDTPLSRLSMGQQARAALAKLLLEPADVLLLDEPTNHLDIEALRWLESYLEGIDVAFVIVSHDRALLDRVTTTTWSLHRGVFERYPGPCAAYFAFVEARDAQQRHAYARQQREIRRLETSARERMDWSSQRERDKVGQGSVDRGYVGACAARQAKRAKATLGRIKHELETRRAALPTLERRLELHFDVATPPPPTLLALSQVSVARGERVLTQPLTLQLEPGGRVALMGPNGCGKSTLLKVMAGILREHEGHCHRVGRVVCHYVAQDPSHLLREHGATRVIDVVTTRAADSSARTLLACLGFVKDDVWRPLEALSPGQLARVALARALLSGAHLLLLDEPTNHLDVSARQALERGLQAFPGGVVVATHDRRFVDGLGAVCVDALWC